MALHWNSSLHPRDGYGRFGLKGLTGKFDTKAAAAAANSRPAKAGLEHVGNGHYLDANNRFVLHDEQGKILPIPATHGAYRVGDNPMPRPRALAPREQMHGSAGGLWHVPGEYDSEGRPKLRDDTHNVVESGIGMSRTGVSLARARTRSHKSSHGPYARSEDRASAALIHRADKNNNVKLGADELAGAQRDPLQPNHRRRTARVKLQRRAGTTRSARGLMSAKPAGPALRTPDVLSTNAELREWLTVKGVPIPKGAQRGKLEALVKQAKG